MVKRRRANGLIEKTTLIRLSGKTQIIPLSGGDDRVGDRPQQDLLTEVAKKISRVPYRDRRRHTRVWKPTEGRPKETSCRYRLTQPS